jgi:hypothetical protein
MVVTAVCELLCDNCMQFVTLKLVGFSRIPIMETLCIQVNQRLHQMLSLYTYVSTSPFPTPAGYTTVAVSDDGHSHCYHH